ncbi:MULTISPECIES: hypothetical protein [Sphingobacterium]|uniref:Single-stranded DNA-binding protein n=1 Tax=Sphingobacterium populi TaxID=1812824 RepID=A0ABW5U7Y4_9SPHI|nr:hypothetical protein [Sphingobacterium sp. CFCC 11742]
MALTKIKGIIKEVLPVQTYGQNGEGRIQTIVIFVPGYVDRYTNEKKSADEEWGVSVFNENIDKHGFNVNSVGKVVEADITLQGRSFDKSTGGKAYSVNVGLKQITVIAEATKAGDDDDLPF